METETENIDFAKMLAAHAGAAERLVYYKIPVREDAEDILQEVYLTAFVKFGELRDRKSFKSWLLRIASNRCSLYYRRLYTANEVLCGDDFPEPPDWSRAGVTLREAVGETLVGLARQDRELLERKYIRGEPVGRIAERLAIPVGTVKSRLSAARAAFRAKYPYPPKTKGDTSMSRYRFSKILPEIRINKTDAPVFPVLHEELPGWFVIPRAGEKAAFAVYVYPEKICDEIEEMEVVGKARIHGLDCVEITCSQTDEGHTPHPDFRLFASVDDAHVRYLANLQYRGDVRTLTTFLDDDFLKDWGIGEDNCGRETHLAQKNVIRENGGGSIATDGFSSDLVGVYDIAIDGKTFRTVKLAEYLEEGIYTESYITETGRTVLERRYNRVDWHVGKDHRYKIGWSERLPENRRLSVNGQTYIHWYDCLGDCAL